MSPNVPNLITNAMARDAWCTSNSSSLLEFLGQKPGYPDVELFESTRVMQTVYSQLDVAGYPDDPEFCMTRVRGIKDDHRLVFDVHTLFIGGATLPGEDVFIALDLYDGRNILRVFDWEKPIPKRWNTSGNLEDLAKFLFDCRTQHN